MPTNCFVTLQVQQLFAELSTHPEASGRLQPTQQSSYNSEQTLHLTNVNKQLGDSVADLDLQLDQAQQEIDSCHAQIDQLTRSLAAQRAQHDDHIVGQARGGGAQAEQAQAELTLVQEDCTAKALQVPCCTCVSSVHCSMCILHAPYNAIAKLPAYKLHHV